MFQSPLTPPTRDFDHDFPSLNSSLLGHDRHALGMDGAQVGVLKEAHEIRLGGFLESQHRLGAGKGKLGTMEGPRWENNQKQRGKSAVEPD